MSVSLAGCATTDLSAARERETTAKAVSDAYARGIEDGRREAAPADLPDRCRKTEKIGAKVGERLDVVVARADAALGRANLTIVSCAKWHDAARKGTK